MEREVLQGYLLQCKDHEILSGQGVTDTTTNKTRSLLGVYLGTFGQASNYMPS